MSVKLPEGVTLQDVRNLARDLRRPIRIGETLTFRKLQSFGAYTPILDIDEGMRQMTDRLIRVTVTPEILEELWPTPTRIV